MNPNGIEPRKKLGLFCLVVSGALLFSAITGIHKLHFSTTGESSVETHSVATRLITLAMGVVFFLCYLGLKLSAKWGTWVTNALFLGVIGTFLWQGIALAFEEKDAFSKIWAATSQIGLAALVFILWRKIMRRFRREQ